MMMMMRILIEMVKILIHLYDDDNDANEMVVLV